MVNIVKLFPNVFRAIAIAKLTGNCVNLIPIDDNKVAKANCERIKDACLDYFSSFSEHGGVAVRVGTVVSKPITDGLVTVVDFFDSLRRVDAERECEFVNTAEFMFRNIQEHSPIDLYDVEFWIELAQGIANLDGKCVVDAECVLEAYQYIRLNNELENNKQ